MKRLVLPLLAATFFATSSTFAAPGRLLVGETHTTSGTYDVLENVWLILTPGAGEVYDEAWVDWMQDSTRVRVYLSTTDNPPDTGISGTLWSAKLPVNHAGTAYYSYTVVSNGVEIPFFKNPDPNVTDPDQKYWSYTIEENYDSANTLGNQRYPNISSWENTAAMLTPLDDSWYGAYYSHSKTVVSSKIQLLGTTDATTDPIANQGGAVQSSRGLLRSPIIAGGIGSIWLKARMSSTESGEGLLRVARMTKTGSGRNTRWWPVDIASIRVPPAEEPNQWQQFRLVVQEPPQTETANQAYYLIYNNTFSGTGRREEDAIDVCDIVLTPPIPEVEIVKDRVDYSPSLPSILDPIDFRIEVRDVYHDAAPAQFITPRLVWRQGGDMGIWREQIMTNLNGRLDQTAGVYAYSLTKEDGLDDGPFEYFYEVSFTGYTPRFLAIKGYRGIGFNNIVNYRYERDDYKHLIDTNSLALLTVVTNRPSGSEGAVGFISECRSPAVYPDFERQYRQDFLYPFSADAPTIGEYDDWRKSAEIASKSAATNSLWGYTRRFDVRNLVTKIGAESKWGGTINLWRAPRAEAWHLVWDQDAALTTFVATTNQLEEEYRYLSFLTSDGVRRFRSKYASLGATTEDHPDAERPSLLAPSYPMQQVGDYTWQAIIHITNRIDSIFCVTGACPTAAGANPLDPEAHEDRPLIWRQVDQSETDINPPMSGERSFNPSTGEPIHNELVLFDTERHERPEKVIENHSETTREPGPAVAFDPGTIVGVVTNENYCSIDGGSLMVNAVQAAYRAEHPPTDNDVAFWFGRLVPGTPYEDEVEPGVYVTVHPTNLVDDIALNVYPNGDRWDEFAKGDFVNWIVSPQRVEVTNALRQSFATNIVTETREWSTTTMVNRVYYDPIVPEEFENSEFGTRVDINYDGFLMFRFCTTNGSYQIRRAAWQDFNEWQADNDCYDQSFGLYDMKTFTSDAEGRSATAFAEKVWARELESVAPTPDWTDGSDGIQYVSFQLKNGKVVRERGRPDWNASNKSLQNNAFLLDASPRMCGSVTTTDASDNREEEGGAVVSGGRDTLKMKVRSFSDDDRVITYKADNADTWSDYRVVAVLGLEAQNGSFSPDPSLFSPGEHSISLIGYYQGPGDYWEARIVQKSMFDADGKQGNWFEVHVFKWTDGEPEEVWGKVYQNSMQGENNWQASSSRLASWPGRRNGDGPDVNSRAYGISDNSVASKGLFTYSDKNDGCLFFVFDLKTEGSSVKPVVWSGWTKRLTDFNNADNRKYYYKYDCSGAANLTEGTTRGRPGWNSRDCGPAIGVYVFDNSGDTPEAINFSGSAFGSRAYKALSSASSSDAWDFNKAGTTGVYVDVWGNIVPGASTTAGIVSPVRVKRLPPTVYYQVQVYRTDEEDSTAWVAPVSPSSTGEGGWNSDWDGYHGHQYDRVISADKWTWEDVPIPMNFWDDTFIHVVALDRNPDTGDRSKGKLMVDGISCSSWRGKTFSDPEGASAADGWSAHYAAISVDPAVQNGRRYELNRSRANPTERAAHPQSIVSPPLENGVGGILFSYEVTGYPVRIDVQIGNESGSAWRSADGYPRRLEATTPGEKPTLYVPFLRPGEPGRIRIVALDENDESRENGHLGTLYVDNLRATDYPKSGDSSWEVYNALVSDFTQSRESRALKFDGSSDAAQTMRSAVLNDATGNGNAQTPVADTAGGRKLADHAPFVQTPAIETGVGEISFWYRASPDNGGVPARITLLVAPDASEDRPDSSWRPLEVGDLWAGSEEMPNPDYENQIAALNALNEITTDSWTYFNVEFFLKDDHVLRIVSGDGTTIPGEAHGETPPNRVMIDNVLITEPVRSSIDVGTIEFLPGVPTTREDTHARVTLVNPRLNPDRIEVYLDWFVADGDLTDHDIESVEYEIKPKVDPIEIHYNTITHEIVEDEAHFNDPGVVSATYDYKYAVTNVNRWIDTTVVPASLADPQTRAWGYASWSNRMDFARSDSWTSSDGRWGTIAFTNGVGKYTYYSAAPIPTTGFEPDSVMQYCVRVKYEGRFKSPVFSELQGRVKNGFWFENPDWYAPIDLNVDFGTEGSPVSHVFVFSCTTNAVRINEIRPWLCSEAEREDLDDPTANPQADQFIELIGPAGATIGQWRIEHWWNVEDKAVDPDWINYTNVLKETAAFRAIADLDETKGWGFYVLGGSAIERDEDLFREQPASEENGNFDVYGYPNGHPFINTIGGMRLRRRMGAYVDRIAWGTVKQAGPLTDKGFDYAGYIRNSGRASAFRKSMGVWGDYDADPPTLGWDSQDEGTPGDFAIGELDLLPWTDGTVDERLVSYFSQPVFTGMEFETVGSGDQQATYAILTFQVTVTNDVALDTAESSARYRNRYDWNLIDRVTLTSSPDRPAADWLDGVPGDENNVIQPNETRTFRVRTPVGDDDQAPHRFYWIEATPVEW